MVSSNRDLKHTRKVFLHNNNYNNYYLSVSNWFDSYYMYSIYRFFGCQVFLECFVFSLIISIICWHSLHNNIINNYSITQLLNYSINFSLLSHSLSPPILPLSLPSLSLPIPPSLSLSPLSPPILPLLLLTEFFDLLVVCCCFLGSSHCVECVSNNSYSI